MGQMITKPDANPIVIALCNFLVCGALGYYLAGQQKKAVIGLVIWALGWVTCGLVSSIWAIVAAYDGFLLRQKLQSGQAIGENENALPFLNNIIKD